MLQRPPLTVEYCPLDVLLNPPPTNEQEPIASLLTPPTTAEPPPSAPLLEPPPTKEQQLLAELKHLKEYAKTFCFILNGIYENKTFKYRLGEIKQTHLYYIVSFHYGKTMPKNAGKLSIIQDDLDESLKVFIENDLGESYKLHRLLKYYKHENGDDIVYFIKAKQKRYWLNSIAIKDADGVLSDLIKAGY